MTGTAFSLSRRQVLAGSAAMLAAGLALRPAQARAPLAGGGALPGFIRYKVGDFEITALNDGTRPMNGPEKIFGINQKSEDVAAAAAANFLPTDKLLNGFTPVMVNTGKELVLFDSGNGAGGRPNAGNLAAQIAAAGFAPEQIDVVVITHCHGDHIGGLMEEGKPLAPNARYVIGRTEYDFWSSPDRLSGPTENGAKLVQANVVPFRDKMTFLENEGEVVSGIRSIDAFGHTPGHCAWSVESAGKRIIIGADFCNHYALSLRYPDWHVSFDMDKEMGVTTRKRMLDMLSTDRLPFTSYHMPFPAVGFVDKGADGGYRFVPATYQMLL